ncbi:helix-turn-helix domain-containing protein [Providencia rettgeri]|nr:helix-turn-helix domain-containing protein [Providencia rettgeri]
MDQLINCLNLSINTPFSLEKFAQEHQMSARSLQRLFKSKTGMTVMEYLQQLRLCQAALLLRSTSLSISEVAGQCGYEDSNYFRVSSIKNENDSKCISPLFLQKIN